MDSILNYFSIIMDSILNYFSKSTVSACDVTITSEDEQTLRRLEASIQFAASQENNNDFLQSLKHVIGNQAQVKLLQKFISEMSKTRKVNVIDMEDFRQTIEALEKFCSNLETYKVKKDLFYPQIAKIMGFLKEEHLLPLERYREYINICKEKSYIERKLDEYNSTDISKLVELIKTLQDIGLLSGIVLSRYKMIVDKSKDVSMAMGYQIDKMQDFLKNICIVSSEFRDKWSNSEFVHFSEESMSFFIYCWESDSSELSEGEIEKLINTIGKEIKPRICRSEHKTPFCGNCGWRTSWLKAFKKRGVYVKVDTSCANKNIWHNKVEER